MSQHPVHDIPHDGKTPQTMPSSQTSDLYVMYKGYDSEKIHELIRNTLNSCSRVPVRNRKRKNESPDIIGDESLSLSKREKYLQRNKVETVFSVLKRKFGESRKTRKYRLQVKEFKIKVIFYNHSRMISSFAILILVEEFYRAKIFIII